MKGNGAWGKENENGETESENKRLETETTMGNGERVTGNEIIWKPKTGGRKGTNSRFKSQKPKAKSQKLVLNNRRCIVIL